jgi:hypothetical protein
MSKAVINDELTNPELLELEASLRGLSAAGNVNRDALLFEAGRRSTNGRLISRSGLWRGVSTVLALMLVGQSFLFWSVDSVDDRQIADDDVPFDRSATVQDRLPSENGQKPNIRIAINADLARRKTFPTRRFELLQLRRVALTQGVDAAFSPNADDIELPRDGRSTQQELLRELLGS